MNIPRSFHCAAHRDVNTPEYGKGCWRCELREALWLSRQQPQASADGPGEEDGEWAEGYADRSGASSPRPFSLNPLKFRATTSNLPEGFIPYVRDHSLTFSRFRDDPSCRLNSRGKVLSTAELNSAWGTVEYWRRNVVLMD